MRINETYYSLLGLSYIKGFENFEKIMPRSRMGNLLYGCLETNGFKWCDAHFVDWILAIVGREERRLRAVAELFVLKTEFSKGGTTRTKLLEKIT